MSWDAIGNWFGRNSGAVLRVALLFFAALPLLFYVSSLLRRALLKRVSPQTALVATKCLSYGGVTIIVLMALIEFGISLTPLLGAAGIMGIAIGFASQTSLSNLISGLFLIAERPFQIGDLVRIGEHTGLVHSIDLLSVKLRTFDNMLIRIPNETMIKSAVVTVTAFPIRRMDVTIGVAYKENIPNVIRLLKQVANEAPECLDEPEPLVSFKGFAASALEFQLGLWFAKDDFQTLRDKVLPEIKRVFDEHGIKIQ